MCGGGRHRHVHGGAGDVARLVRRAQLRHQPGVAGGDGAAVHHGPHAPARDFLRPGHPGGVDGLVNRPFQGQGNGMVGIALRQGGQLEQPRLLHPHGVAFGHAEAAPGQGAGLVEHHGAGLGQGLQVVAALDEDALTGGPADAAEKAQRDGNHQRAGAGDDQEDERPVEPLREAAAQDEGRQHGQQRRADDHHGGVIAGEFGDEILGLGLLAPGVLRQLKDLSHRGFPIGPAHPDAQQAGLVDAAADDRVARRRLPGHGFPRQGGGVQQGAALQHLAVQGHPLAGLDHDDVAHRHLLGIHAGQAVRPFHVGVVGADIHQRGDGLAGTPHRVGLEPLAHLVEEHDGDGLGEIPNAQGADGGDGHQEVLVENLAVGDVPPGPQQHVPADDKIGDEIHRQRPPARQGRQGLRQGDGRHEQDGPGENADKGFLLFFGHAAHGGFLAYFKMGVTPR